MILNNFQRIKCFYQKSFRNHLKSFSIDSSESFQNFVEGKRKQKIHNISQSSQIKCLVIHPIFPDKYSFI